MSLSLIVKNLDIDVNNVPYLRNVSFNLKKGDVLAVLGPNGAGKSTLLKGLMNHYNYPISKGKINLSGKDITYLSTDKKARAGMFYCNQNPLELPGVKMLDFFKLISKDANKNFYEFYKSLDNAIKEVGLKHEMLNYSVNVGFSGGEKKRNEILQAKVVDPKVMLIDEIDSGLDLDAIKMVANYINKNKKNWITIIVSHHIDFLRKINPNKSIVLIDGKVAATNQKDIINFVSKNGYKSFFSKIKVQSKVLPITCPTIHHGK